MTLLEAMREHDYEEVIALNNNRSGLRGFIVIHDTTRGPALGGIRVWRYEDEAEALADGLRLARAMTYKAALAGLDCGGGKAVVIEHPEMQREEAMRFLGRVVESLHGRFQTGRDLGLTDQDIAVLRQETRYIGCEGAESDDYTALGVMCGIRACLDHLSGGQHTLSGLRVAVQGLGGIGWRLAQLLRDAGCHLIVADIDREKTRRAESELGATVVPPEEIYSAEADVFSPCAVGGVITQATLPRLRARIIAGSANNVLADASLGWHVRERGILYAPDYLINAGALIHGANLYLKGKKDNRAEVMGIYDRMREVLRRADEENLPTNVVADRLAEQRVKPSKTYRDLFWSSPTHAQEVDEPARGCCG